MALLRRAGQTTKWLSSREVCDLLAIADTQEAKASTFLASHAEQWGIRKITRDDGSYTEILYSELDVIAYMKRREQEASRNIIHSRYRWREDKKEEKRALFGKYVNSTKGANSYFIEVEVKPNDSIPPLEGYVNAAAVAERFAASIGRIHSSAFFRKFSFYLGEEYRSNKLFDGDMIELYFKEKRDAGEKVYMLSTRQKKRRRR